MRWFRRGMPLVHAVLLGSACGVTDTDEPTPIDTVVVTPPALQLTTGGTGALAVEVTDAAGRVVRDRRVVWVSANPSIASVTDNGVVSAVSAGRVDIAASAEGKTGVATVTVVAPPPRVASVRITPDRVSVFVAGEASLVASALDNQGRVITGRAVVWTTNNVIVAAVSQTGQVTGLAPGTAVITAVIEGVSGTATVSVSLAPVARVVVTPSDVSINEGKNTTLTARTMDASGHTLTGRAVTWSSSDTRIVTIDQSGVARGVRRGSVVITATSEGKVGTATVRVQ
jgi:trimeric autotransporter adhesin